MSLNTCRPANRRSDFIVSSNLPFLRTTLTLLFCLIVASTAMFANPIEPPKQLALTGNFPVGVVNAPYHGSLTATGGTAPYTYSAPGLPKGLTCNATTGGIS